MNKSVIDKLKEGREYRNLELRSAEEQDHIVEGYATTYNQLYCLYEEDGYRVLEQVDPHAFDECDMSDVIFQYNHEGRVFARLSNGSMELKSDEHGLKVIADLGKTEIGRQLYEEIKGGYTNKMSFGFVVKGDKVEQSKREDGSVEVIRTITQIGKLYDVSAVSLPANDTTSISARNFGEGVIAEVKKEILEQQQKMRQAQKIRILLEVDK